MAAMSTAASVSRPELLPAPFKGFLHLSLTLVSPFLPPLSLRRRQPRPLERRPPRPCLLFPRCIFFTEPEPRQAQRFLSCAPRAGSLLLILVWRLVCLSAGRTSLEDLLVLLPPSLARLDPMQQMAVREPWETEELVEEILIRTPPEDPAALIRASLACKAWCNLLSGHAFRSRYITLHKTPPILGFLESWRDDGQRFFPINNFCPRNEPNRRDTYVLDCRHVRILVACVVDDIDLDEDDEEKEERLKMVVWDPVSGRRTELPDPDILDPDSYYGSQYSSATLLCATKGCNHGSCKSAPFLVAFIFYVKGVDGDGLGYVYASVYSSATVQWTSPIHIQVGTLGTGIQGRSGVLVGRVLYVLLGVDDQKQPSRCSVVKHDLDRHHLSVIDLPELCGLDCLLISSDDGGLGAVQLDEHGLCLIWLMEVSHDGLVSWNQVRQMDLKTLGPIGNPWSSGSLKLVGCVEGASIILVMKDVGLFAIDLESLSLKLSTKMRQRWDRVVSAENLFLYMSFSNPPAVAGVVGEASSSEVGGAHAEVESLARH